MKTCTKCGKEKEEGEFYPYPNGKLTSQCKRCYCIHNNKPRKPRVCDALTQHHNQLKDDPEHLTTEFIQKLVGVKCK